MRPRVAHLRPSHRGKQHAASSLVTGHEQQRGGDTRDLMVKCSPQQPGARHPISGHASSRPSGRTVCRKISNGLKSGVLTRQPLPEPAKAARQKPLVECVVEHGAYKRHRLPCSCAFPRHRPGGHSLEDCHRLPTALSAACSATAQGAAVPEPRRSRTAATACCWLSREPAANTWSNRSAAQRLADLGDQLGLASPQQRPGPQADPPAQASAAPASSAARWGHPPRTPAGRTRPGTE
jgi:hypothetical protein